MGNFKIGVMLESFKCSVAEAVDLAVAVGASGVQFYGVGGELDCDSLIGEKRTNFKKLLKAKQLAVSAVCADLGGHGFERADDNEWKISKTCRTMELAKDMDCSVITTHIGVIPKTDCEARQALLDACRRIGEYGEMLGGVKLAIETGPERCETLKAFLEELHSENVGVNFDPANLVMVTGDDPVKGVYILRDYIVHTHVKDGIMIKQTEPKIIYDYFADGGIEDIHLQDYFVETALGKGTVDLKAWTHALTDIGYNGFYTIERETGSDPYADIKEAVKYLMWL